MLLMEASENGSLSPPVDDLLIETLAQFIEEPLAKQFW